MLKKSVLIGALSMIAYGSAQATGFYMGAGLGALEMKTKLSSTTTVTTNNVSTVYAQDDFSSNGALNKTLLLGYDWFFANHTFLGVEAFISDAAVKTNNTVDSTHVVLNSSTQLNTVYGLRLLPGFTISQSTVVYGIVGYVLANAEFNNEVNSSIDNATKNLNGYQLGVGAMDKLSQHVAMRGDLIYTGYQQTTFTLNSTDGAVVNTYTLKPYTLEANVSLLYQFGGV